MSVKRETAGLDLGSSGGSCPYCGCWHNYSYEMCRDMANKPAIHSPSVFVPDYKDIQIASLQSRVKELEESSLLYEKHKQTNSPYQCPLCLTEENITLSCNKIELEELIEGLNFSLNQERELSSISVKRIKNIESRLQEAEQLNSHDWQCGCSHWNGSNLAHCADCGRKPNES